MKNITVTVDDETYRRARIKAAERDTSVSALVRRFLADLAAGESDVERLKREERELKARIETRSQGMNALRFIDTNVLLYSISRDPAESSKRAITDAF